MVRLLCFYPWAYDAPKNRSNLYNKDMLPLIGIIIGPIQMHCVAKLQSILSTNDLLRGCGRGESFLPVTYYEERGEYTGTVPTTYSDTWSIVQTNSQSSPVMWIRIRIWIGSGSSKAKIITNKRKKFINFIFWSAVSVWSLLRAEDFSSSLDVL